MTKAAIMATLALPAFAGDPVDSVGAALEHLGIRLAGSC